MSSFDPGNSSDEVKDDHAVIEAYLGQEMDDEEVRAALHG